MGQAYVGKTTRAIFDPGFVERRWNGLRGLGTPCGS